MKYITTIDGETFEIEINSDDRVVINGKEFDIDCVRIGNGNLYSLILNNESFEALVEVREANNWEVLMRSDLYAVEVADERSQHMGRRTSSLLSQSGDFVLKAPMPGLIVDIPVEEGQNVEEGETLIIMESMKMENELKAARAGVVEQISVTVGERVEQQQALVVVIS